MKQKHKQVDYTLYEAGCQLKLPIETEKFIAADNPVRLVSAVVERIQSGDGSNAIKSGNIRQKSFVKMQKPLDKWIKMCGRAGALFE
ncbi:MAG: hypothetical protein II885_15395, partial [Oscillospiraceae bacterium]|nr:hypothetical protein [Oscillospiraceae bacterium]